MWHIILVQVDVCCSRCVRSVTDAIPDECDPCLKCEALRNRRVCEVGFVCKSNCFFAVTLPHLAFKSECQRTTNHEIITVAGFSDTSGLYNTTQFFFLQCHHVSFCGLRGPPSWAWQKCNRLLRLGRPWGAVTLSQWCVSGDRGGCSSRRGLKPKLY